MEELKAVKNISTILEIVEGIGTDFPPNVQMKLFFKDIEPEQIRRFAKQEPYSTNFFEANDAVPYCWLAWTVCDKFEVFINGKY